jgi:hypothetical protein
MKPYFRADHFNGGRSTTHKGGKDMVKLATAAAIPMLFAGCANA